ncbi:MAG: ImmA/IrrE family metallo-endopeptidase [Ruminococcaceae bacterium]|nr:ImmA/IrrE family metallo-endopeptidase [Oscillospiraceae bacterium]
MEAIKNTAVGLAARFGTSDPFEICEGLDVCVLRAALPQTIRGFYTFIMGIQMIYLNAGLSDGQERKAVCAHELGHAVLHAGHNFMFLKENTGFIAARFEREADLFAGYLLLDEQTIYDCRCNGWTAGQIAHMTALPERVVDYCFKN